jgi:hypothetical protein
VVDKAGYPHRHGTRDTFVSFLVSDDRAPGRRETEHACSLKGNGLPSGLLIRKLRLENLQSKTWSSLGNEANAHFEKQVIEHFGSIYYPSKPEGTAF